MDETGHAPAIRYGFIGTGMMGCEHIRDVKALPGAEAVAAADPNPASRERARAAAGEPEISLYDSAASMLEAEKLDVVVVATPNHLHRASLDLVWGSDLHVMIEKPLCTTVADCLAVRDAAAQHPGVVWMGLEYRYMPPVRRLLDALADGAAGEIRMLFVREHRFPFLAKVDAWNRFNRHTGGTLVEKCCHFFDLMNVILPGRPVRVMASGSQDVNHLDESYGGEIPDILDNAFVIVDYDDGRRALLDLCMFAEGSRWEQEIVATGDLGKVEVHLPGFMELSRGRRAEMVLGERGPEWPVREASIEDDPRILHPGAHHGASYLEHLELCHSIRTGRPPAVTVDDGLVAVAMGVAAHRSIDEGRPVALAELGLPAEVLVRPDQTQPSAG
jgi:myo-inositol 2-dehydrogenase / D-chiro-inositol 1-dehydrogenase